MPVPDSYDLEAAFPLRSLLADALDGAAPDWTSHVSGMWCNVRPSGNRPDPQAAGKTQGWKLHVSATVLSAPLVLVAAARVLIDAGCPFKFAATLADVGRLTDARAARASGGKFLTAYPERDGDLPALAAQLHAATLGLPGPAILSDRRYRPGSLVHYRFGAFTGVTEMTNDGTFESLLTAPDGSVSPDHRAAWFTPPAWASDPFGTDGPRSSPAGPATVLLNGRYEVRGAIQHANKGGVFHAVDRTTGLDVVIKQARPHTQASIDGTDGRDLLRHEAAMLDRVGGLRVGTAGITPRLIGLFEHGGDLFLAQERLTGPSLREWVDVHHRDRGTGVISGDIRLPAEQLVEIVGAVHAAGLVIRDLSPNNIIVSPSLRLIDLEHMTEPGTPGMRAYTPAYGAPEVTRAARYGVAPGPAADLFSLGATLFFLAAGFDPRFADDHPATRRSEQRIAALITLARADHPALEVLAPLVTGLTRDDPAERWSLDRARLFLAEAGATPARPRRPPAASEAQLDEVIADGLEYLHRLVATTGPAALLMPDGFAARTDRCAVQHGAAGVLAVLVRANEVGIPGADREQVDKVAGWIARQLPALPRTLPGLYFGRSGTVCALYDASVFLGDASLAEIATTLAERTPLTWPNPDVCHGAAGAGLAAAHLWHASEDDRHRLRMITCADGLVAAAERDGAAMWWPVPASFDSVFAGAAHLGFGHGVAGIGSFLLQAANVTGSTAYLDAALAAGETLTRTAIVADDIAWWPVDRADRSPVRGPMSPHWCSGASGIATFLIRLWSATDDDRFRSLAERGAETAWRARWNAAPVQCHGSAGDGELLLDLAVATGDESHRRRAAELAATMIGRHTVRDGLSLFTSERGDITTDYQTGLAGTLSFLIRLRHGGHRMWMAEPPTELTGASASIRATSEERR